MTIWPEPASASAAINSLNVTSTTARGSTQTTPWERLLITPAHGGTVPSVPRRASDDLLDHTPGLAVRGVSPRAQAARTAVHEVDRRGDSDREIGQTRNSRPDARDEHPESDFKRRGVEVGSKWCPWSPRGV